MFTVNDIKKSYKIKKNTIYNFKIKNFFLSTKEVEDDVQIMFIFSDPKFDYIGGDADRLSFLLVLQEVDKNKIKYDAINELNNYINGREKDFIKLIFE